MERKRINGPGGHWIYNVFNGQWEWNDERAFLDRKQLVEKRSEIMNIMHDLVKRYNLDVMARYDSEDKTRLIVEVVKYNPSVYKRHTLVSCTFDLLECEIDDNTVTHIEDTIINKLAEANGGYYLKNMDVASWYPDRMICQDFGTRKPIKSLSSRVSYRSHADGFRPTNLLIDEVHEYCRADVEATKELYEAHVRGRFTMMTKPEIKKVHFNDPVTVVIWKDGTKTIVRAQNGEKFDPEKGLAMAISKKVFGNNGNYFDEFKKWIPEEKNKQTPEVIEDIDKTSLYPAKPMCIEFDGSALKNVIEEAGDAILKDIEAGLASINAIVKEEPNNED